MVIATFSESGACFGVHDWIDFKRIIAAPETVKVRSAFGENHDYALQERRIEARPGRGIIRSIAKGRTIIDGLEVRTARVNVGKYDGGTITVILDDAVLVGKQQSLFGAESQAGPSMYDVRGDGA